MKNVVRARWGGGVGGRVLGGLIALTLSLGSGAAMADPPAFDDAPRAPASAPTRPVPGTTGGAQTGATGLTTDILGAPLPDNPPGTPSRESVKATALRMGIDPDALQLSIEGLGDVYARNYSAAEQTFQKVIQDYPQESVGHFGLVLLYQSWMLENYDYTKEKEWLAASEAGVSRAEAAIAAGRQEAWSEFVRGSLLGIDSIYQIRRGEYLSALNKALKAITSIERSMALDPEFTDPALCMGVYNYWRTVLTEKYWFLPSFGDHKAEGLNQIRLARDKGVFTGPGARLALAYAYLEERQVAQAKDQCRDLAALYPNNLINNMLLGRIALTERRLRNARWYFDKVKEVSPENWLVEYYLGLLAMRERRWTDARDNFQRFLSHDGDMDARAWAHYRLGDVYWQMFMDDLAAREWQEALKLQPGFKGPEKRVSGQRPPRGSDLPPLNTRPVGTTRNGNTTTDKPAGPTEKKPRPDATTAPAAPEAPAAPPSSTSPVAD